MSSVEHQNTGQNASHAECSPQSPELHLGTSLTDDPGPPVLLPVDALLRHMVCLGSSGSGKTVACKVICEEVLLRDIPVIAIDPQGDIASMILPGEPPDQPDAAQKPGFHQQVEVVVWTPGSGAGVPLSLDPLRLDQLPVHPEERVRVLSSIASQLTALLGYSLDSGDGQFTSAYLDLVLQYLVKHQVDVRDLSGLCAFLQELPESLERRAERLIKPAKRAEVGRKLEVLGIGARRLLFHMGAPIRVDTLLGLDHTRSHDPDSGRPLTRLSVIYLNALHAQEEKEFFVGQIAQALYNWMLEHPAPYLQAILYLDEIAPFLPPVRKPACKDILKLLFKQARKYGIGCLIASQNPGDIDYMALSQFSTWALGRMMVQQDIKKVERMVRSLCPDEVDQIIDCLPRLEPGQFALLSPDVFEHVVSLQLRWLLTQHMTLDEDRIAALTPDELRQRLGTWEPPENPPAAVEVEPESQSEPENQPEEPEPEEPEPPEEPAEAQEPEPPAEPEEPEEPEVPEPPESPEEPSVVEEPPAPQTSPLPPAEEVVSVIEETPRQQIHRPPTTNEAVLLRFFQEHPGAYTVKELTHETAMTENIVRRSMKRLVDREEMVTVKVGRGQIYWKPEHRFAPTVGVVRPILTASPQADREQAFQLARKACDSALFGLWRRESIEGPMLRYLLLWRVVLLREQERGLWRKVRETVEHPVYFHASTGDLLIRDSTQHLQFLHQFDGTLQDLGDLGTFSNWTSIIPAELGLSLHELQSLKSPQAVKDLCTRLFACPLRQTRLVALPYWCFSLCRADGKKRLFHVDALFGKPLRLPFD